MQPQYPYPQQPPAQPYAQPPMPQYPPQQPAYAPPMPGYPQQQYAPPMPQQPAAPPLPTGTLDTFYQQPSSGGGPSFKFMDANRQAQVGKFYEGFVARPVTDADVRAQTNEAGQPQTFKDGRTKFVMVVPMMVQPSPEFPEGQAGWWVKGQARDELARAMAEAGAPQGPPEHGAFIRVTLVGTRAIPGRNPAYQYRVDYVRPNGAAPGKVVHADAHPNTIPAQQVPQGGPPGYVGPGVPAQPQIPAMQPGPMGPTDGGPYAQQYTAPPVQQVPQPQGGYYGPTDAQRVPAPPQPVQQVPAPVAPQTGPAPVAVAQPAQMPAGLSTEQMDLFARLTNQQAAPTA